jgi:NHLM bacteriocin system ABC transporter peptidase/ATP-binding protein
MEAVECGAASLAIVLAFYGLYVPLEDLRVACGVSRDGATAASVMRAARRHGMECRGFQKDIKDLKEVDGPFIVFWAFQHFLVVERLVTRFGRSSVYINDPEGGRRRISMEEFDISYTGIVLTLAPGPEFRRGGHKPSAIADLSKRWSGSGGLFGVVGVASLLLVVPGIAAAGFTRFFIDDILGQQKSFLPLAVVMITIALLVLVLTVIQQSNLVRLSARLSAHSGAVFFKHMLSLPVDFFLQRQAADLGRRVRSNNTIADILSRDVAATAVNMVLLVFYAIVLLTYDVVLAVVGMAVALLNLVVLRLVSRARKDSVAQLRSDRGKLLATSFNAVKQIETIKASGAEASVFERWSGFQGKVVTGEQRLGGPTALLTAVPPFLATFNAGLILLIGGLQVMDGSMSLGLLVAFIGLLASLTAPITQMSNLGERMQDITADLARISDVERYPSATLATPFDPDGFERLSGAAQLVDISFGYSPLAAPIIESLSLDLLPGRRTALVGGSGSGKSTVGKLLAGLVEPRGGEILLDGRPHNEITREELALSLAYVDQDAVLFEGTIRENVTLWDPTVSDEEVAAALRDAAIHDLVLTLPKGLRSPVEEGGRNFSGGQRQRLAIARALVRRPTLLILDEATSALDAETERKVDDNLRQRGCACLIIAHRLSTVRDSDEIIALKDGAIVERGTHRELMGLVGEYHRLVTSA